MKNAILMASGLGTRMRPLTEKTPKPLIKVNGIEMIETVVATLNNAGVDCIYVVVGYLAEQFSYLQNKYKNVVLLKNDYYKTVNNISSIYVAREVLMKGDTYICEADLYINNRTVLCATPKVSGYYGKMVYGHSDDWLFETDKDEIIKRVCKGVYKFFNMVGVSFFLHEDATKLAKLIEIEFGKRGNDDLFWDDVVNKHIQDFKLEVIPVGEDDIFEIDTLEELNEIERRLL